MASISGRSIVPIMNRPSVPLSANNPATPDEHDDEHEIAIFATTAPAALENLLTMLEAIARHTVPATPADAASTRP
jgi:hypothetical protein